MNQIEILYENDEIFVIDKPAGLAVQGGQGVSHSLDVDFAEQTGQKVYLVHRLDKDTRGLMIVAKNPLAAGKWTKLIASKAARKEYLALCIGRMPQKSGVIKENLFQHGEEKSAVTHYLVEREWNLSSLSLSDSSVSSGKEGADCGKTSIQNGQEIALSLIRLKLETGRMHQIRIHLAKNGCPIAGDDQHGNFKMNKVLRKAAGIKRLQLAAVRLTLPLKEGERTFEIHADFE
ncbi:MAG: RluA family pseudouridine synthase [Treponema sp.]|nr:RluA family pseudouridine synthase [Treponema sp.]